MPDPFGNERVRLGIRRFATRAASSIFITVASVLFACAITSSCSPDSSQLSSDSQSSAPEDVATTQPLSSPFSARFEVATNEIKSGASASGTIVLVNSTGSPIVSTACSPALYQTELIGNGHQSDGSGLACAGFHVIEVGETRIPVQFSTNAQMCSQPPTTRFVQCLSNGSPPPLAPGVYELTAWSIDKSLPIPSPVRITILS